MGPEAQVTEPTRPTPGQTWFPASRTVPGIFHIRGRWGSLGPSGNVGCGFHREAAAAWGSGARSPLPFQLCLFFLTLSPYSSGSPLLCLVFNLCSRWLPARAVLQVSLASLERSWIPGREEMETRQGGAGFWRRWIRSRSSGLPGKPLSSRNVGVPRAHG